MIFLIKVAFCVFSSRFTEFLVSFCLIFLCMLQNSTEKTCVWSLCCYFRQYNMLIDMSHHITKCKWSIGMIGVLWNYCYTHFTEKYLPGEKTHSSCKHMLISLMGQSFDEENNFYDTMCFVVKKRPNN